MVQQAAEEIYLAVLGRRQRYLVWLGLFTGCLLFLLSAGFLSLLSFQQSREIPVGVVLADFIEFVPLQKGQGGFYVNGSGQSLPLVVVSNEGKIVFLRKDGLRVQAGSQLTFLREERSSGHVPALDNEQNRPQTSPLGRHDRKESFDQRAQVNWERLQGQRDELNKQAKTLSIILEALPKGGGVRDDPTSLEEIERFRFGLQGVWLDLIEEAATLPEPVRLLGPGEVTLDAGLERLSQLVESAQESHEIYHAGAQRRGILAKELALILQEKQMKAPLVEELIIPRIAIIELERAALAKQRQIAGEELALLQNGKRLQKDYAQIRIALEETLLQMKQVEQRFADFGRDLDDSGVEQSIVLPSTQWPRETGSVTNGRTTPLKATRADRQDLEPVFIAPRQGFLYEVKRAADSNGQGWSRAVVFIAEQGSFTAQKHSIGSERVQVGESHLKAELPSAASLSSWLPFIERGLDPLGQQKGKALGEVFLQISGVYFGQQGKLAFKNEEKNAFQGGSFVADRWPEDKQEKTLVSHRFSWERAALTHFEGSKFINSQKELNPTNNMAVLRWQEQQTVVRIIWQRFWREWAHGALKTSKQYWQELRVFAGKQFA
ncbi:hypothetical protein [Polycladidibacter stylochi]|uniref:hypothetical protein n=1 Tax=Polycladidibacter stylochi TaxID=1807766 RepID=UPI00082F4AC8|nr:hypothetical protein [Pseudovibrio stylochi]